MPDIEGKKLNAPELKSLDHDEFMRFLHVLGSETDRGLALVCAAIADDLLGKCIRAFLLDRRETDQLFKGLNAPLRDFAARSVAAFALGLLSEEEYRECEIIRKVRNEFAHNVHVAFEDQKVRGLCANLKNVGEANDPRDQFSSASVILILQLQTRPTAIDRGGRRLKFPSW
jgi:mannitol operon repressor